MTAVYVLLWLISSAAWADAVRKIGHYTDPTDYFTEEFICECAKQTSCVAAECKVTDPGNYSTANVSIVRKCCHLYLGFHLHDCKHFLSHRVLNPQSVSLLDALKKMQYSSY